MADLAQRTTWLTEAEAARHDLMLGKRVAGGCPRWPPDRVQPRRPHDALDADIQSLQGEINAINSGETVDGAPRRAPRNRSIAFLMSTLTVPIKPRVRVTTSGRQVATSPIGGGSRAYVGASREFLAGTSSWIPPSTSGRARSPQRARCWSSGRAIWSETMAGLQPACRAASTLAHRHEPVVFVEADVSGARPDGGLGGDLGR